MSSQRVCFYLNVTLPDSSVQKVRVVIFPNMMQLNNFVHRRKIWPEDRMVYAITMSKVRANSKPNITMMFYKYGDDAGVVAHECGHALMFIARHYGINDVGGRPNRRFKSLKIRGVNNDEEWFCSALERIVNEFYLRASKERKQSDSRGTKGKSNLPLSATS